jgi:hypothetical protein
MAVLNGLLVPMTMPMAVSMIMMVVMRVIMFNASLMQKQMLILFNRLFSFYLSLFFFSLIMFVSNLFQQFVLILPHQKSSIFFSFVLNLFPLPLSKLDFRHSCGHFWDIRLLLF